MDAPHRPFPTLRLRGLNHAAIRSGGRYVLYWMTATRRPVWNFGLQRAADWARSLRQPLLVLEALRCDYRWASDRLHHFVIAGMADNQTSFRVAGRRIPALSGTRAGRRSRPARALGPPRDGRCHR